MGFLDNLLKDIANGDIDKKLGQIADTVENFTQKMEGTAKNLADKPENLSKKVDQAGHKAVNAIKSTAKSIDGINK